MRDASNPVGRTAALGLLHFVDKWQAAITLKLLASDSRGFIPPGSAEGRCELAMTDRELVHLFRRVASDERAPRRALRRGCQPRWDRVAGPKETPRPAMTEASKGTPTSEADRQGEVGSLVFGRRPSSGDPRARDLSGARRRAIDRGGERERDVRRCGPRRPGGGTAPPRVCLSLVML
jgi:hypothetical protein